MTILCRSKGIAQIKEEIKKSEEENENIETKIFNPSQALI